MQTTRRIPGSARFQGMGQMPPADNQDAIVAALGGGHTFTNDFAYTYVFPIDAIPAGGTGSFSLSIDQGSDFLVTEIAASARYNAANTPTGLLARSKLIRTPQMAGYAAGELIQADIGYLSVLVTQTDRQWMKRPVPLDQCSGDAANPYVLATPIWISQKTTVNVEVTNNMPAVTGVASPIVDVVYSLIGMYMKG